MLSCATVRLKNVFILPALLVPLGRDIMFYTSFSENIWIMVLQPRSRKRNTLLAGEKHLTRRSFRYCKINNVPMMLQKNNLRCTVGSQWCVFSMEMGN